MKNKKSNKLENKGIIIDSEARKPSRIGPSTYFKVRPSKVQEDIIKLDQKYLVYAVPVD